MAFGQLGLGEYFWEMETCEFINAWQGHLDQKRQDYTVLFETARFGAFYNVFSNDQAKALKKAPNPYTETDKQKEERPVTMDDVSGLLSGLAKASTDG